MAKKNTKENNEMKNENENVTETTDAVEPSTTKKSKKAKKLAETPNSETSESIGTDTDANQTDIPNDEPVSVEPVSTETSSELPDDLVYAVEKDGEITTVDLDSVYTIFDGKYTMQAVDKTLEADKVLTKDGVYYSRNRKKLVKFEAKKVEPAPVDAPETETQGVEPVPAETPSNDADGAGKPPETADQNVSESEPLQPEATETESVQAETEAETPKDLTYETDGEAQPFEVGDKVMHVEKNRVGLVLLKGTNLQVSFDENGKHKSVTLKTKADAEKWRVLTPKEVEAEKAKTALAKKDSEVIEAIPDLPLTAEELAELTERKDAIFSAKADHTVASSMLERAENVMAENIAVIREKNLWRDELNTKGERVSSFKEFITDVLGFNDKYGTNLAQIGDFRIVAKELTDGRMDISVNANNAMLRGMRKIAEGLGVDELGFSDIRPVIKAGLGVIAELATDAETGEVDFGLVTPRVITAAADIMLNNVRSDTVEIDGEQMTIAEAKAKGVLDTGFRDMVMKQGAESILTNKAIIKEEITKQREENTKPPTKTPESNTTELWKGEPSRFGGGCTTHKSAIISIGNGQFQCACLCRYRMSTTGVVECFEIDGKQVR